MPRHPDSLRIRIEPKEGSPGRCRLQNCLRVTTSVYRAVYVAAAGTHCQCCEDFLQHDGFMPDRRIHQ
jgi:hypothetical protein